METMNIQSVAEKNIVSVVLADIQPSNYNPRKNFDVASLAELAFTTQKQNFTHFNARKNRTKETLRSFFLRFSFSVFKMHIFQPFLKPVIP